MSDAGALSGSLPRIGRIADARFCNASSTHDIDLNPAGVISAITPAGSTPPPSAGAVLAAEGRTVTSGLWDEHVHFGQWAQQASRLDLGEAHTVTEALALVAAAVAAGADEVIAVRTRGSLWGDELHRDRLDRISTSIPLVLIGADLHGAWLNSAALGAFGHPTSRDGHIVEDDCFALVRELDRISDAALDERVYAAAQAAAAHGVVGIVDFEMRWTVDDWLRREANGFELLRVEAAVYPQYLDRALGDGLRTGARLSPSGRLRCGPLKVITDGSLGTHTAWCYEPYPDGGHGRSLVSVPELVALLRRAHGGGISAAVHAIGDRANSGVLEAFAELAWHAGAAEAIVAPAPAELPASRIEHAQLLRSADLPRFVELALAASVQPQHLLDDRSAVAQLWPGRGQDAYPFASILAAGGSLRFGSDAPVAPLNPWHAIGAAVHRALPGEDSWFPAERITVAQALAASMRGRLIPQCGDVADLILCDVDPLSATHEQLLDPGVAATLLGGRLTHGAGLLASSR